LIPCHVIEANHLKGGWQTYAILIRFTITNESRGPQKKIYILSICRATLPERETVSNFIFKDNTRSGQKTDGTGNIAKHY